jgi:hypothetical protein
VQACFPDRCVWTQQQQAATGQLGDYRPAAAAAATKEKGKFQLRGGYWVFCLLQVLRTTGAASSTGNNPGGSGELAVSAAEGQSGSAAKGFRWPYVLGIDCAAGLAALQHPEQQ